MKKLKVILAVLCASTLALGLAACKNGDGGDNGETGKKEISAINESNQSPITLTDSDTATSMQKALEKYNLSVNYKGASRRETIKGSECELVFGDNVSYGNVGTYYVVLKPTQNNPNNLYSRIKVEIEHDWSAPDESTGMSTCDHCNATLSGITLAEGSEETLTFKAFHDGENEFNGGTIVKEFGSVRVGRRDVEVPSYTVGRLTKGASITVTGRAKANSDAKAYYFPIIGIADSSVGSYTDVGAAYQGTSVIVRNEGWTLLNGVGNSRMLAYLASNGGKEAGSNENHNYGSHIADTGAETDTRPQGYDDWKSGYTDYRTLADGVPFKASDYKDWFVYTEGTQLRTTDYSGETGLEIAMTWTYRNDGIVELTIANPELGSSLVARVRVPDNDQKYYETIIHGDFMSYTINGASYVTPKVLDSITATAAEKDYLANTMLDFADVNVMATYLGEETAEKVSNTSDYEIYGFIPNANGADEVESVKGTYHSLRSDPLQVGMTHFKVVLTVGPFSAEYVLDKDHFVNVLPNAVDRVISYPVSVEQTAFGNSVIDGYTLALHQEGGNNAAKVALTGFAGTLTEAQKTALGTAAGNATKYVAFRVYANENGSHFTTTGTPAGVAYCKVSADGTYADVVIALTKESGALKTTYTVTGLQPDTAVVFDITGIQGVTAESKVTVTDSLFFNKEGSFTIEYTFPAGTIATANAAYLSVITPEGTGTLFFANNRPGAGLTRTSYTLAKADGSATENWAEATKLTVTLSKAAAKLSADSFFGAYTVDLVATGGGTLARDVIKLNKSFSNADGVTGQVLDEEGKTYAEVSGDTLFIARILSEDSNIETADLAVKELTLNFNKGEAVTLYNLAGTYRALTGEFVLNDVSLSAEDEDEETGAVTRTAKVNTTVYIDGTADDNSDVDYVAVVLYAIDLTQVSSEQTKLFDVVGSDSGKYYEIENGVLSALDIPDAVKNSQDKIISEDGFTGDCFEGALVAKEIKDGDNVLFYAGAHYIGGEHVDENNDKLCDLCGSSLEGRTPPTTWWAGQIALTLNDGEFIDYIGTYSSKSDECGGDGATMNAFCLIVEDTNVANYVMNGEGYFERRDWNGTPAGWGAATVPASDIEEYATANAGKMETYMTNSLITEDHPYNTLNGYVNGNGVTLDGTNFNTLKTGASFRYTISYRDGKYIARFRMWEEGVNTVSGIPVYDYTYTLAIAAGKSVVFNGYPGATYSNSTLKIVRGTFDRNILTGAAGATVNGYTSANVSSETPVVNGSEVTLALTGMADKVPGTVLGAGNDYYVAFALNFSQNLAESTTAQIVDAQGNAVANAVAKLDGTNKIAVLIPLNSSEQLTSCKVVLANMEADTHQTCEIVLDLSGIMCSDYAANLTDNLTLAGGTATFAVTGGTVSNDMKVTIGETTVSVQDIAANTTKFTTANGTLTVTAVSGKGTANFSLSLALSELNFKKALVNYTITLATADGSTLATSSATPLTLPSGEAVFEGVYAVADGNELTLVVTTDVSNGATKELKLNVNNKASEALRLYNTGFKVNGTTISFLEWNALTANATAVYTNIGNGLAAVTFDLSKVVESGKAYGFEAFVGSSTTRVLRSVAADGTVAQLNAAEGAAAEVHAATCAHGSVNAKTVEVATGVNFYYDITVGATVNHVWGATANAAGYLECERCDAVKFAGAVTANQALAADALTGVAENGLTVSFALNSASADWGANIIATSEGNLVIGLPNVQANAKKALTSAVTDEALKTLFGKLDKAYDPAKEKDVSDGNFFPGVNGGSNLFNGGAWNCYFGGGYATIAIDPANGVSYYLNGKLVIYYPLDQVGSLSTSGTNLKDYVNVFLALAEQGGLTLYTGSSIVKGVREMIVQPYAITAEAAAERFEFSKSEHTHTYDPATHKCEADGAINPDPNAHKNSFVNGVCTVCGFICPHSDNMTDAVPCDYCGATVATTTDSEVTLAAWGTGINDYTLTNGKTYVLEGTYSDGGAQNWFGIVTQIRSAADNKNVFFLRPDKAYMSGDPMKGNWEGGEKTNMELTGETNFDGFVDLKKTAKTQVKVEFLNKVITVTYTIYNANNEAVHVFGYKMTDMTDASYTVGFALDSATLNGNATVTTTTYTFPSHEHVWGDDQRCTVCGILNPAHTHAYESGYCAECKSLCPHTHLTEEVCDDCGLNVKTATAFVTDIWVHELNKGETKKFAGTITSGMAENYQNICLAVVNGWTMRTDNYDWVWDATKTVVTACNKNGVVIKNASGENVTASTDWWVSLKGIIVNGNATWEATYDWTGDDIVCTITYTAHTGEYAGYTWSCSYNCVTGDEAGTKVNVQFDIDTCTVGMKEVATTATPDNGGEE